MAYVEHLIMNEGKSIMQTKVKFALLGIEMTKTSNAIKYHYMLIHTYR